MDKQKVNDWILNNSKLINKAIRSLNLFPSKVDYQDLLQNAYCAILDCNKYYKEGVDSCSFSSYMYKVIRDATRRYYWKNKFPVSISCAVADYVCSNVIHRKTSGKSLTDTDYTEIRDKLSFGKDTINIIENLIDKDSYTDETCELLGVRSRQSIDAYEDRIDLGYLKEDLTKKIERLPKAYQKALCESYSIEVPLKCNPSKVGSKCNNKYHLKYAALKELKRMYKDRNIGDYIDD